MWPIKKWVQDLKTKNYQKDLGLIEHKLWRHWGCQTREGYNSDHTLWKLQHEGWRVCGWYVWKTSSSFEQSRSSWIDVLQGPNKLEGAR